MYTAPGNKERDAAIIGVASVILANFALKGGLALFGKLFRHVKQGKDVKKQVAAPSGVSLLSLPK